MLDAHNVIMAPVLPKAWPRKRVGLAVIGICLVVYNTISASDVESYGRALLVGGSGQQQSDPVTVSTRQRQGIAVLERMKQEGVFTTNFSSPESVLDRGFQRLWNPCALERRFRARDATQEPVRVVVTGGSPSSRPGDNCTTDGRYASLLQERFQKEWANSNSSMPQFQVINMAQGGTTSVTGALLMDQYIDTNKTDVVIWEFLINGKFPVLGHVGYPTRFLFLRV